MTLDSPTAHTMQNMSRLYTKVTGTEVQVNIFSYDSVHELLSSLNAANAFDIIRLDGDVAELVRRQNFRAAGSYRPRRPGSGGYVCQRHFLLLRRNVRAFLYAFPENAQLSSNAWFYRQDLFSSSVMQRLYKETYRAELRPPETFEEYNRIASFFTRRLDLDPPPSTSALR